MNDEQLKKILQLERNKGYLDTAVFGGLDKCLDRLSLEDPRFSIRPYPSYRALNVEQREEWIETALKLLKSPASPPKDPKRERDTSMLNSSISVLPGLNAKIAAKFNKLGVVTLRDLLYHFPKRHVDYSTHTPIARLRVGEDQTSVVQVRQASKKRAMRGMRLTEAIVGDETGNIRVIWFNQPFLAKKLIPNSRMVLSGRVNIFKGNKVFHSPSYEFLDSGDMLNAGRLVPVYPLTEGLFPRQVRRFVKNAMDRCLLLIDDFLPNNIRSGNTLMPLTEAIQQAHFPDSEILKDAARRRLAFDELFLMQLAVLSKRRDWLEGSEGISLDVNPGFLNDFLGRLPFELTVAQKSALEDIRRDIARDKPMSRLLQGDVGSGKTVVATAGMLLASAGGCQAALMAPTEILAGQHYRGICSLLGDTQEGNEITCSLQWNPEHRITLGLLTGSMKGKAKRELLQRITSGEVDIVIGTQALIQKTVDFHRLGLAVVDEQHRFGVMQRLQLRQKGPQPHLLAMSATPIPRTLALTLYGDLDISVIDELPPGRRPIKTRWLSSRQRKGGYDFVRKQVAEGRQAFVVYPLIEESESLPVRSAVAEHQRLSRQIFPDLRVELLHGRMAAQEKEDVMQRFRLGSIDILVSTSVIEVGIDVPNATVMMVEGAERFGLSQLHQFRGRVWRSSYQGYCLLLSDSPTLEGRERLAIMEETQDGFRLAEEDLKLRGPGEFFGTRQSGMPDLKMARLSDVRLLELARNEAIRLFKVDPELSNPEHEYLAALVEPHSNPPLEV